MERLNRMISSKPIHRKAGLSLAILALLLPGSLSQADDSVPAGLPAVRHPEKNPPTPEKIALGKQLYFDPRLSQDNTVSCATCHDPRKGWSNGDAVATGVGGLKGGRSAPTIINAAYGKLQFWDGRAADLEEQALGPIQNPIEMTMTLDQVVERLNQIGGYKQQFQKIYGTDVTSEGIALAIASYERTILSGDAPYDRFKAGDKTALSESAQRGLKLFTGKAHCSACHSAPNFTDNGFHNLGVSINKEKPDLGRTEISRLEGDRGAFKTPTLREIARSAPYMHDGSLATLEDVVEYYNKGATPNPQLDEEIFELNLKPEEKADLVTFLKEGLASDSYPEHAPPELPK